MAEIKIFTNAECYYPGNIVEGAVQLTVESSGLTYNQIRLTCTGKERTRHMMEKKIDGKSIDWEDSERYLFFKDVAIISGEMSDDTKAHNVKQGTYTYPFAFKLPLNIPPSLSEAFDKKDFAEIVYQVKAVIVKPNEPLSPADTKKRDSLAKKGLAKDKPVRAAKFQRYFHVIRPMPLSQYDDKKSIVTETPFHLQKCGCCEAGNQIQYIDVARTVVAMDRDALQVVINVDNSAGLKPVKALQLKLQRSFMWRCNDYTKRVADITVAKQTFPKVIPNGGKGVLGGICPLPLNLCPSVKSFNMTCSYVLLIKVLMDGCADQESTYPVTIMQSVDDTNTAPRIVLDENPYTNVFGRNAKAMKYTAPQSAFLPIEPVPSGLPDGGEPSTATCATQLGPLGLPSNFWQMKQEKKEQRKRHANAEPLKYEAPVEAGAGLGQPIMEELPVPTEVKYPASRMGGMLPTLPSLPGRPATGNASGSPDGTSATNGGSPF